MPFDEVVVATGADPTVPHIPGVDSNHVFSAEDALLGRGPLGKRVLIVGGGLVGCEVADFLSAAGKNVILTEMLPDIAPHVDPPSMTFLRQRLREKNVEVRTSSKVVRISEGEVTLEKEGEEKIIGGIDHVVIATGYRPKRDFNACTDSSWSRIRVIGDASEPRDALWAIYEGAKAAREI